MAYRIQEFYSGTGGDAGFDIEYALVDSKGNRVANVKPDADDYGNVRGYYADISTEDRGSQYVPIDLAAINAKAAAGPVPFGKGMGPALGYEYTIPNANGDAFRKFDAEGNLTEYLDRDLKWQKASDFKPSGMIFNSSTGQLETTYENPNSPRKGLTESNAWNINQYKEDQGGFLGEGGWRNIAGLAAAALTAGFASPAISAIQAGTGLGAVGAGALYGGATGALSGAIKSGGQGALTGGLLGAAGGALSGALGGGGAEAIPVEAPNANFTGMDIGNPATWGAGEFQPFAGGDVGLGSGYLTQFNPDGSFVTLPTPSGSEYTYTAESAAPSYEGYEEFQPFEGGDVGLGDGTITQFNPDGTVVDLSSAGSGVQVEEIDPSTRGWTDQEVADFMEYGILPAEMQAPAGDWLDQLGNILPDSPILKNALLAGGLAAASALAPKQDTESGGGGGFTVEQLKAMVDQMPSAVQEYIKMAEGAGSSIQPGQLVEAAQAANLFPNFVLPTSGQYGAGRFMNIPTGGIKI